MRGREPHRRLGGWRDRKQQGSGGAEGEDGITGRGESDNGCRVVTGKGRNDAVCVSRTPIVNTQNMITSCGPVHTWVKSVARHPPVADLADDTAARYGFWSDFGTELRTTADLE